jgi:hypothetical protein
LLWTALSRSIAAVIMACVFSAFLPFRVPHG